MLTESHINDVFFGAPRRTAPKNIIFTISVIWGPGHPHAIPALKGGLLKERGVSGQGSSLQLKIQEPLYLACIPLALVPRQNNRQLDRWIEMRSPRTCSVVLK